MSLQMLIVLAAAGGAAFHLLRAPLAALFGRGGCASNPGCAGCSAPCPVRKLRAVQDSRDWPLTRGRLP
jgi:hypothetical protein